VVLCGLPGGSADVADRRDALQQSVADQVRAMAQGARRVAVHRGPTND
jgi:hypothetical protein